jgi:hypothetical protein
MAAQWRLLWLACLLGPVLLAAACDAGTSLTFRNETSETLFVGVNHKTGLARLPSDKSRTIEVFAADVGSGDDPLEMLFVDERGCTAFETTTIVRKFRKENHSVMVISERDLIPVERRTECDPILATPVRNASY